MNTGSAYVFVRSRGIWTEQTKLTASDATISDDFGWSASIDGDTAIVGAVLDDHAGGAEAGSAYVFVRSGGIWTQQAKLTASDAAANDWFGWSVSIDSNTAIVGVFSDDHSGGADTGSAYVFMRTDAAWIDHGKLTASDAEAGAWFGMSVSIDGDTAIVGERFDDHAGGKNAGSAYVYQLLLPCSADINGDGTVDIDDLFEVIAAWGPCAEPCPPYCSPDIDDDCDVDIDDLFAVIAEWS